MAALDRKTFRRLSTALLTCMIVSASLGVFATGTAAQSNSPQSLEPNIAAESKLLLSANELVYNRDAEIVSAVGSVQINYNGYKMVAQRVEYNQKTGRMMAAGNIELIEQDGNRIYADSLDVTDNFAEGFLNSLRVETTDNTRLAGESAERLNGNQMILNNGVYTACLPCAQHPERAPLWQIKAKRVIQNGDTHTVRLERARFELFGMPIAFLPVLQVPDQTVKRKSGFLFPSMSTLENLGFGLTVPYYYRITNSMDLTISPTGYTNQGLLLDVEFRQRLNNGTHVLRVAGISQSNPDVFSSGSSDAEAKSRGLIQSRGDFVINPRWAFGWDVMVQSDNNFSRTYELNGRDQSIYTNQVYLTGLGERNIFDMRAFYFDIQDSDRRNEAENKQAVVYPSVDYSYVAPDPVLGGELTVDTNFTNITRSNADYYHSLTSDGLVIPGYDRFRGLEGRSTRLTTEAEWKRTFIAGGVVLTPLLAARGDVIGLDVDNPNSYDPKYAYAGEFEDDDFATRAMLTAGLEARYPILLTTDNSSHIFEPIAQIYARPNEPLAGMLPNEDAQSFVFDATSLFERDKYSGYDRIEGGTRANVGIRYTGSFDSGYTLRSLVGQSYHLAGTNSFADYDLVNVGADSGLETDQSDYVGMFGITAPNGLWLTTNLRLDEKTFEAKRTDATVGFRNDRFQTKLTYTQIAAQPLYGAIKESNEIQSAGLVKLNDQWAVLGSITWDVNENAVTRQSIGLSYEDECTIFSVLFTDKRDVNSTSASDWTVGARLSFRTLGDIALGTTTVEGLN